jgi:hypothetical protein
MPFDAERATGLRNNEFVSKNPGCWQQGGLLNNIIRGTERHKVTNR